MSYQHGYQQQPNQPQQPQQQQPYGGYQGGGGYPDSSDSTNPAVAIIAAVLALAAAASLVVVNFYELGKLDGIGFGDLPGEYQTIVILRFAAALVLLAGAIIVFARKLAGAIITVLGGLAGIAAVLLYPVLLDVPGEDFGSYLEAVFQFDGTGSTFSAIALIASPLALILAILPPTLNYLKGSGSSDDFGGYPQQPQQQGW